MPGEVKEFESTGGIDPTAFAADLFPSNNEPPEPSGKPAEAVSSPADTPPSGGSPSADTTPAASAAAANAGMSQETYDALPKAWRKEMEAEWKGMSVGARKYVYEREKQAQDGISFYKPGAENWGRVVDPFKDVIAQYPDANLPEILSTLANNHLMMLRSTPEQRREHAIALARGYGVDLTPQQAQAAVNAGAAVADQAGVPPQPDGFSPAQIKILERTFGPLLQTVQHTSQFVNKQLSDAAQVEVDKFFSDKNNEFVNEVAEDILSLIKNNQARNLLEAYEIAVMRNPEVKAKYLTALAKKSTPPPSTASNLPNVKSSATPISQSKPLTIDQTVDSVIRKHYG